MMTVKKLSDLTGISVRTLHYYDEIGIFIPAEKSEAGYQFYDEESLEILIQIVFFREFGVPLKKTVRLLTEEITCRCKERHWQQEKIIWNARPKISNR